MKDQIKAELDELDRLYSHRFMREGFLSFDDAISHSSFPYRLVREDRRDYDGKPLSRYVYRWTSPFFGKGCFYLNETKAGRQYPSIKKAFLALRSFLDSRLADNEVL